MFSLAKYCHECGHALSSSEVSTVEVKAVKAKKPRKASAYNLQYKKQYAILKKAHPRTSFAALAKKAHRATKRVMR